MQLPQYVEDFLNYLETIKNKSPNTIKNYKYDLINLIRFIKIYKNLVPPQTKDKDILIEDFTIQQLKEISCSDIYKYLKMLLEIKCNLNNSRVRKIACLKTFFKWCKDKSQIIEVNPVAELEYPKTIKPLPKYLTLEESKKLLSSISGKYSLRNYAILTLFLNCGMRLSELCGLNINDYKNQKLRVTGKGDKERDIYLNNACLNALDNYIITRPISKDKALFLNKNNKRISQQSVQLIVKHFISISGLCPNTYSTHKLRHTAATLMYKYGHIDIRTLQEILGHKHISTTEIYTHVDNDDIREAMNKHPLSDM